jgi:hypothetical protein
MLSVVAKGPVGGGARPHPVAILREKFDHDAEPSIVGQLEGRVPALSRPGASRNKQ